MGKKRVVTLIVIVAAVAAIVIGSIAVAGGFSSDSSKKSDVPTGGVTSTSALGTSASPSVSASPGYDDSGNVGPGPSDDDSDEPSLTTFRNMTGQVGHDGVSTPGTIPLVAGGEVHLAAEATVECVTVLDGTEWSMEEAIPDGGEDDFLPFGASGAALRGFPGESYPWTMTCTSSDGVVWSESGTVTVVNPDLPPAPPDLPGL